MTNIDALSDGEYTGVVDSIEDGLATVFVEQDGGEVADATLPASDLPPDGRHADAILSLTIEGGAITDAVYESETTQQRADDAQSRFDRLSERPPSDQER